MCRSLGGVGPLDLGGQAEQDDGQLAHGIPGFGGVDGDGVGQASKPDAGFAQVVDLVEDVLDGSPAPIEGVDHEGVAGP